MAHTAGPWTQDAWDRWGQADTSRDLTQWTWAGAPPEDTQSTGQRPAGEKAACGVAPWGRPLRPTLQVSTGVFHEAGDDAFPRAVTHDVPRFRDETADRQFKASCTPPSQ